MTSSLEDRIARMEAMLEHLYAAHTGTRMNPVEPEAPAALIDADLIEIGEAARDLGRTKECVRLWVIKAGIGQKLAGRWYVPRRRLQEFLTSAKKSR